MHEPREARNATSPKRDGEAVWLTRLAKLFGQVVAAWSGEASRCRAESAALVERIVFVRLAQAAGWTPRDLFADDTRPNRWAAALAEGFDRVRRTVGDSLFFARTTDEPVKQPAVAEAADSHGLGREPQGDPRSFCDEALAELVAQTLPLTQPEVGVCLSSDFLGELHQRLLKARCPGPSGLATLGRSAAANAARRRGVYYTPSYVADYIAARALAQSRREGPAPGAVRLLDPACGCGAFLLAADRAAQRLAADGPPPARLELYGMDTDPGAVVVARRSLVLATWHTANGSLGSGDAIGRCAAESGNRIRWANALGDNLAAAQASTLFDTQADRPRSSLPEQFDIVVGNPPYHRELGGKAMLDALANSPLGRRHRTARMDLWHYFLHRGLEWLAPGAVLSYIVPEYWVAGRSGLALVDAIRRTCRVAEVFLLEDRPVFDGVAGRHMILTLIREQSDRPATIRRAAPGDAADAVSLLAGRAAIQIYTKSAAELFVDGGLRLEEPHALDRALVGCTPLSELADVCQGIVENPATATRKTCERFGGGWVPGEGVFVLRPEEVERLGLSANERDTLRPYHYLADLGRYYVAPEPSRQLIYSTAATWPDVDRFPCLRDHLARFRTILDARRETQQGRRPWWQLHWPRDERTCLTPKIVALQMAARPTFAVASRPLWAPFSVNVLVPHAYGPEELHYLTAVLNSRLAWEWFRRHAKHRGVGLDINGHVLRRFPVRTLRTEDPAQCRLRGALAALAVERAAMEVSRRTACMGDDPGRAAALDEQIDCLVDSLYGVDTRRPLRQQPYSP